MIIRLLRHVRSNVIAYMALVLSTFGLAGGAYAALAVPPNSVGALQLRNHSIIPVKLNARYIAGSVRHWAQVDAKGRILASSSGAHDTGIARDGAYVLDWSNTFSSSCVTLATVRAPMTTLLGPPTGYADTAVAPVRHSTVVWVMTYNAQGQPAPMGFSVAVIC
jgi:hypothetical protein